MKYIANPVEVEAHIIIRVGSDPEVTEIHPDGSVHLKLQNGQEVVATKDMCSRYLPREGDYWVIQSDGYTYLNPKEVFERKYRPA